MPRQLTLKKLKCEATEDWTGADECRLEVYVDGIPMPAERHGLNDQDVWSLNRVYVFLNEVEVKLYDEDWPDGEDFLGAHSISSNVTSNATLNFTQDDAKYTLYYEVKDVLGDAVPGAGGIDLPDVITSPPGVPTTPSPGQLGGGLCWNHQQHRRSGCCGIGLGCPGSWRASSCRDFDRLDS